MAYYVNKTDGTAILVLDGTKDTTSTSITLIGRLSQSFGEAQNENFVHLLENFALDTAPPYPIKGQLWFDTTTNTIKVYRTDSLWSEVGALPSGNVYINGNIFVGGNTLQVLDTNGNVSITNTENNKNLVMQANVSGSITDVLTINGSTGLITVASDPSTNLGVATKIYVDTLGSSLESSIATINANLSSLTSNVTSGSGDVNALSLKLSSNTVLSTSGTGNTTVNFKTPEGVTIISASGSNASATPVTVNGQWSLGVGASINATYADLAEYYSSDQEYESGTVVVFGGEREVTVTTSINDTRLAGIVSTSPAYTMNTQLVGQRICLALQGRVPCKVIGPVHKGDLLTTADTAGYATRAIDPTLGAILGKSLENNFTQGPCIVEIAIGRA
jgi:hypothetical protein